MTAKRELNLAPARTWSLQDNRLYKVWFSIHARCGKPNDRGYGAASPRLGR
jgi:hypothetical protein